MQKLTTGTRMCFECGSTNIDYDPVHESKYCKDCGTVIDEYEFV